MKGAGRPRSDFEKAMEDPVLRKELAREGMIVEATEAIAKAMERSGVSRAELARRLGRHRSFVTRLLSGSRNLTVATVGEALGALGFEGVIELREVGRRQEGQGVVVLFTRRPRRKAILGEGGSGAGTGQLSAVG